MARKKSEILESADYWLESFEKGFLREFERVGKTKFEWGLYKEWQKAVVLYVRMHEVLYGVEPPYNSEFMQAVAISDVCCYTFLYGWPERVKAA